MECWEKGRKEDGEEVEVMCVSHHMANKKEEKKEKSTHSANNNTSISTEETKKQKERERREGRRIGFTGCGWCLVSQGVGGVWIHRV